MEKTRVFTKLAFIALVGCVIIAIVIQDHTGAIPFGLFNTNQAQINSLSNLCLVAAILALVILLAELAGWRVRRLAAAVRWVIAFVILFEIFLFFSDKLVMTGHGSRGRGTHYEESLADGTPVIMRRSAGGMPVKFCEDDDKQEFRVLLLGDSYTEGSGRAPACNYPDVVERELQSRWRADVRVIKAGVNAYGPVEALNLLRWYREKGCRFDAVVYNFFLENDFTDNLPASERRVVAGIVTRFPESAFLKTFHPLNTRVFRFALYVVYVSRMSRAASEAVSVDKGACDPNAEMLGDPSPFLQSLVNRRLAGSERVASRAELHVEALAAIGAMRTIAHQMNLPFVLVVFPDRVLVDPELQQLVAPESLRAPREVYVMTMGELWDLDVIDATDVLDNRPGMYRRSDTHLSDIGNQTAARYVAEALTKFLADSD